MKRKNICIWKLEKNISEIRDLLKKDYSKPIESLLNVDMQDSDKKLLHKWIILNQSAISNNKIKINGTSYEIIKCRAEIEYSEIPEKLWVSEDVVLSREIRVKKSSSDVIFIEINQCTYCIVCGPKAIEGKIRSNLMESRKRKLSSWGDIQYKQILGYQFNKEFYYWLIMNKGKTFKGGDKSIKLVNVKGFKSSAERQETSYSGEGDDIDKEIPLMSLVSIEETLNSLYINIRYNDKLSYSFAVDDDGRLSVCESECGEFATQTPKSLPLTSIIMDIYFDIIPFLLKKFNEDKANDWECTHEKFKKKVSLDIILELVKQSKLSLKEIESALGEESSNDNTFQFEHEIEAKINEEMLDSNSDITKAVMVTTQ